jgi:Fe-S oxidoreductase
MNNIFDFDNNLYTHNFHLSNLITETGIKNIYDATAQCTRCGYCLESCPVYVTQKKESMSPRARNQIVRMLIEGKFKDANKSLETIDTCLLCSACTSICYGSVPTADIVLEARRETKNFGKGKIYRAIIALKHRQKLFDFILKFLYLIKKIKLSNLADKLGLFKMLGMPSLSHAQRKIIKLPSKFLHQHSF